MFDDAGGHFLRPWPTQAQLHKILELLEETSRTDDGAGDGDAEVSEQIKSRGLV